VYQVDNTYTFVTRIFYPRGELDKMTKTVTRLEARAIFCHIALFEGLKFLVTFPLSFDISLIADGLCTESLTFFREVAGRAWSQHMFENGVVGYWGPEFVYSSIGVKNPIDLDKLHGGRKTILASNGGGKDSFLVMKLLEQANIPMAGKLYILFLRISFYFNANSAETSFSCLSIITA
jgi:hypothetical protein